MKYKPEEQAIIDGWERLAKDYEPRELTPSEKAQVERAELAEKNAHVTLPKVILK